MSDEAAIVRNLRSAQAKYVDSAKTDVLAAVRHYNSLKSNVSLFLYPDGKKRHAFQLEGTLPVNYKNSIYNIPVSITLWDTHPYYAPICHVKPTSSMVIKESEHVNKQGRVFLPYLNEWRFPGYDLYGLIQMMVMIFQDRPPLFAKSADGGAASRNSGAAMPQPQPPQFAPPALPTPYPSDNAMPYPSHGGAASSTPYPNASNFPSPYPMGSGYQPQNANIRPPVPPPTTDTIRASLISAVEERLRGKLRDKLGTTFAERASMKEVENELKVGQGKLRSYIETLEKQNRELDEFVNVYSTRKAEYEETLRKHEAAGGEGPTVDDAIEADSPLSRQLLEAYAADLACDDAYYALGQALKKGNLGVSDYLRHIRDISRQQFEHRATMRKCRIAAGLPT